MIDTYHYMQLQGKGRWPSVDKIENEDIVTKPHKFITFGNGKN